MIPFKKSLLLPVLAGMIVFSGCSPQGQGASGTNDANADSNSVSGKLSFYTSQPEEDATKLISAFNKKYPDVDVSVFRSGTEEVTAKIQAERQAGKTQADVLLLADAVTFENLKQEDLLLSYKSPELSKIPSDLVDPDGMYSGTKVMATVLATNTQKVTSAPTSWSALTAAESKDASIMPSPLYSGAAAYNIGVFSRTDGFGWDFLKQIKDNGISVIKGNGAVMKAVASGEKSYGVVVDYLVAREKAKGSPVELTYPTEGVPIITEPIGIMKDAANVPAAQAFVDYILSDEGQQLSAEIGYSPIREGIAPPEGLKSVSEMNILSGDPSKLAADREADKQQFIQVFGE
ncbi:ABC transporter substrate-binding protein [Paenibacillus sp. MER 99-2]|uniref:ABC transporter substrate-binding protein n=1 Tax=Paenibacillus sp. MER 99-2 TaxID=2939572 RepID=UPI00203AB038|nr:ABC transporter substrate-binding protein [Paenibacillus sp. MER 99-2]MCM3174553.1 ABC transporter substrate-binding protein [Paenibacillus sp. MER 99-2]